jgi:hypothetical protein
MTEQPQPTEAFGSFVPNVGIPFENDYQQIYPQQWPTSTNGSGT